mmetsp:Transcript_19048/g.21215  ORF Transcript_19048/g.21215 Transcript_19048/m.21215 type:complete len:627 (-) Transcript_19048:273-2153(-)
MFQPHGQNHGGQRVRPAVVGASVAQIATSSGYLELFDKLKHEFDQLSKQRQILQRERDEFERKIQAQVQESSNFQQEIRDLDRSHQAIKKQYEEENMRLRHQIKELGGKPAQNQGAATTVPNTTTNTPTVSTHTSFARTTNGQSANTTTNGSAPPALGLNPMQPGGTKRRHEHSELAPLQKRPRTSPAPSKIPNLAAAPPPAAPKAQPMGHNGLPPIKAITNTKQPQPSQPLPQAPAPNLPALNGTPAARVVEETAAPPINADVLVTRPQGANNAQMGANFAPQPGNVPTEEKGPDWLVCYNPAVTRCLEVDLAHTLDHSSVVCCVEFSRDVKYLATGCNRAANIFDTETGKKVHTFADGNPSGGDLYIRSVCFSPDSKFLVTGAEDKTVKVWDIQTKTIRYTLEGHELDIYSLDFSSDGTKIVSGSGDRKIKIWDMETGECLHTLGNDEVGPKDGVTSVSVNKAGTLVSAGSLDKIVRLWDARTGFFVDRYEGHEDSVYSVAFSPDGKSLASGSLDRSVNIWDLSGRSRSRCKNTLTGHKDFVLSVAYSPDGRWLVSGSKDRTLQFWDPRTGTPHIILHGHSNSVISVALSSITSDATSGKFATGSGDFKSRIWSYKQVAETITT